VVPPRRPDSASSPPLKAGESSEQAVERAVEVTSPSRVRIEAGESKPGPGDVADRRAIQIGRRAIQLNWAAIGDERRRDKVGIAQAPIGVRRIRVMGLRVQQTVAQDPRAPYPHACAGRDRR